MRAAVVKYASEVHRMITTDHEAIVDKCENLDGAGTNWIPMTYFFQNNEKLRRIVQSVSEGYPVKDRFKETNKFYMYVMGRLANRKYYSYDLKAGKASEFGSDYIRIPKFIIQTRSQGVRIYADIVNNIIAQKHKRWHADVWFPITHFHQGNLFHESSQDLTGMQFKC